MTPNVAQLLTYLADRTRHVKLGAMAYIVPWHGPIRLADQYERATRALRRIYRSRAEKHGTGG